MDERRAGVLLVVEAGSEGPWLESARAAVEGAGHAASVFAADPELGDRETGAAIGRALEELGSRAAEDRLAAIGFGEGGTQAFLFACTSDRLAAVAVFDAPLVRADLSAERPFQPLEMALNLSAPVFARFGLRGLESVGETAKLLEEVGSRFARDFDIVADPETPPRAWERSWTDLAAGERFADVRESLFEFLSEHLSP